MEEKNISLYFVLTHYNDGEVKRQILMYWKDEGKRAELAKFIDGIEAL